MAITEFVFPSLNPDPALLQELKQILPAAAKATFSDVPGLLAYYRGRVINAQNLSDNTNVKHSGLVIVLEWDNVTSFNEFWRSEKFAVFRGTMAPFLVDRVSPDLFRSEMHSHSGGTTAENYTQYFRVSGIETPDEAVERAWQALISDLQGQIQNSFCAWGVQDSKGMFAGMIGWDSLEAFEAASALPSTKNHLESLAIIGSVSSFVLEVEKQSR
ncbi:Fc.00g082670.m01.CDS01 [Cosmosporella sp. VM-42]